jgi:hypothetical protein
VKTFPACLLLFGAVAFGFTSSAVSMLLSVENIEIKQKGKNSLIAKQVALQTAIDRAFYKLLTDKLNISNAENLHILKQEINDCLYDYSIEQEKYSESVYIAELSCRFDKKHMAKLFCKYGIVCPEMTLESTDSKNAEIVVRTDDFIANFQELKKFNCFVKRFSGEKVIFMIRVNAISDFRKLHIKYFQLSTASK